MTEYKPNYTFDYFHDNVHTVAIYGANAPMVVKGTLVLRAFYTDDTKQTVDVRHTSEYIRDVIFYETNKVIRMQLEDPYSGRRKLAELPLPQLGSEYRFIYNEAEEPSDRYDDLLSIVVSQDPFAHGVGIILKRGKDNGIEWLSESEARDIQNLLKAQH